MEENKLEFPVNNVESILGKSSDGTINIIDVVVLKLVVTSHKDVN